MSESTSYPLIMVQGEPVSVPWSLPDGYVFAECSPELADRWIQLQLSVHAFEDSRQAREAFEKSGASVRRYRAEKRLMILDSGGNAVCAGFLTVGFALGKPMAQLRLLATAPQLQENGFGTALTARLMESFYAGGINGIYLIVPSGSLKAIRFFTKFGFKPYLGRQSLNFLDEKYSLATARNCWSDVEKQLARNGGGMFKKTSPDDSPLFLSHSSMFNKCQICKVFELSAPVQTGCIPHTHNYVQIWYVMRGTLTHTVENQVYEMLAGDVFILPPDVLHSTVLQDGAKIICCEFHTDGLFPDNEDGNSRISDITKSLSFMMMFQKDLNKPHPKFTLSRQGQRKVEHLMSEMLEEYTAGAEFFEDYICLLIIQLLIIFQRELISSPSYGASETVYNRYRSMVEDAIRYIDSNYEKPITLDDVCKISMVSKTYFCYLFKLLTGQTFVEYLLNKRISRAMELLRQSDMSVTDIGQTVGFNDPTNFSRAFKRLKGISPREYRNAAGK